MITPDKMGSEEGWASASTDSRRHEKHRDIKAFIDKNVAVQDKLKQDSENTFYDELVEAAGPVVYAGLDKKGSTTGYSSGYARNYENWIKSLAV